MQRLELMKQVNHRKIKTISDWIDAAHLFTPGKRVADGAGRVRERAAPSVP